MARLVLMVRGPPDSWCTDLMVFAFSFPVVDFLPSVISVQSFKLSGHGVTSVVFLVFRSPWIPVLAFVTFRFLLESEVGREHLV